MNPVKDVWNQSLIFFMIAPRNLDMIINLIKDAR